MSACTFAAGAVDAGHALAREASCGWASEDTRTLGVNAGRDRLILLAAACLAISAQVARQRRDRMGADSSFPDLTRSLVGADYIAGSCRCRH